ncbi:hypothetical protein, partial [Streptomyces sp. CAI-21]|uniref:hypothetical protein n=1 Tax=Streptomyces sp. CAI-21 TaxID=1169743 RepID=UPI001C319981
IVLIRAMKTSTTRMIRTMMIGSIAAPRAFRAFAGWCSLPPDVREDLGGRVCQTSAVRGTDPVT